MVRLATRREVCEGWERDDICPNIAKRVQILRQESRTCKAYFSAKGEFEVQDGKSVLPVSLNNRTCACNLWQISGIPCKHGMRAILHAKEDPHKFVSNWYSVEVYKRAYSYNIKSIPDKEQWPEPDITLPEIAPPAMKRGAGRPPRNRKRAEDEQQKGKRSKTIRCSNCQVLGHNALTCKGGPTTKQKKEGNKNKAKVSSSQPTPNAQVENLQTRRFTRFFASQPTGNAGRSHG